MVLIASWNVNSITVRLETVLGWLANVQPDVLCLQETKISDDKFPVLAFKQVGYYAEFTGQPTYNGVAILAKKPLTNVEKRIQTGAPDDAKRFIQSTFDNLIVVNTYVPNGQEVGSEKFTYKLKFLTALQKYLSTTFNPSQPILWCGDFNIAPEEVDTFDALATAGQIMCSETERSLLREIKNWGFIDTFRKDNPEPGHFSWWDYRMGAFRRNLGYRIDHIWATTALADSCGHAWIDKEPRKSERPSDHAPVLAKFDI